MDFTKQNLRARIRAVETVANRYRTMPSSIV